MKIKLNIILIIFLQVLFFQINIAEEHIKDFSYKGWENLIWGSTESDIKQKYESQLTFLENPKIYGNGEYYCPFEIQNYNISHYDNFTVSFLFHNKTNKLVKVNITMEEPQNVLFVLQDLIETLSEKYGKPLLIEETPIYNIVWNFPELNIEIKHLHKSVLDITFINSIILSYKENSQANKINLQATNEPRKQENNHPIYQLFPTDNYWTFIKLDTRNGKMWQVHFSLSEDGFQGEKQLNPRPLILTDDEIKGRFTLVPTKNIYNFLLLDQLTGKTYQVQWNNDFLNRLVKPI